MIQDLLRPYRRVIVAAVATSVFLNLLLLTPSFYMMQVFDRVFTSNSVDTLGWLTLIALAMLVFYLVVDWLRGRMMTSAALLLDRLLGARVLRLVMDDASQPGFGRHAHLMRDVATLRRFVGGAGLTALLDAPLLPLLLGMIFLFHPLLGGLAVLAAAALIALAMINNRLGRAPFEALTEASRRANRYLDTSLRNAEAVRAMGMFPALARRWEAIMHDSLRQQHETGRLSALVSGASRFSRQGIQVAMVGLGAYLVVSQHATPGVMMATTLVLGRALAPVEHLIACWDEIAAARASWRSLKQALADAQPPTPTELPPLQGRVELDRVVFALAAGRPPLIKGVSVQIVPGEFVGLIGASGSGKSSLLRLLTGVWRPQAGAIRFDGAELGQWDPYLLGRQIGYLPQDIELFPGSVAENIARMAEVDSAAVIEAARRAGAHEMILQLAHGYDTEVGPGGLALSGGQRQRIGLARALYGAPRVVILDEPDSSLDAEGEAILAVVLRQLKAEGVTLIVVSQRRGLLQNADRLMVMKDGSVVLSGSARAVVEKLTQPATQEVSHVAP